MDIARIIVNGSSQAVCLPPKYRFDVDEVVVQQLGDAVILVPKESVWKVFVEGVEGFTTDIFDSGRNQGVQEESKAP